MSKINLQRGKLTVENRKSRERKRIGLCSEVSVNSPGNPWSQSRRVVSVLDKERQKGPGSNRSRNAVG